MTAAAAEVQALLRFLTTDAKVPLAAALPKIGELRKARLNNVDNISKASQEDLQAIFKDEKQVKQVLNAARRVTNPKKRPNAANEGGAGSKRLKSAIGAENGPRAASENELTLPSSDKSPEELTQVTIETNRAPLVLAFAVMLIKHTMPEQPLSSRLSLAQALVSLNSQSKAKSIGLITDKTAEDEGWAQGQPKVRVMGRDVSVMRRAIPPPGSEPNQEDNQATVKQDSSQQTPLEAFWGLDLEALRKSNGPLVPGRSGGTLPIHTPQAARNYLLKSFTRVEERTNESAKGLSGPSKPAAKKTPTAAEIAAAREEAAGMLLKALDLLYESWTSTMDKDELDRKAWSWYMHVRPEVAQGQAGWGQKGVVPLADILKFRKKK